MTTGSKPFSIKIFLANGSPDGLRIVEKTNWTGVALCFPRITFPDVKARDLFDRPGVYVLAGRAESEEYRQRVYIGEADELRARLTQHARGDKEFWTQCVAFTSKDEDLNKAHVRYLEAELLRLAAKAGRAELDNGNSQSTPKLSEAERAFADAFLTDMLLIYPLVGIEAFERPDESVAATSPTLMLRTKEVTAKGREVADGLLVYKGATARRETTPSLAAGPRKLRERLVADGVLIEDTVGYVLSRDYVFSAPSAAAQVLLGRSANGRLDWKDDHGRSLNDIQDAALARPDGHE